MITASTEANKVNSVLQAYVQIARSVSGKFVATSLPLRGSTLWKRLLEFYDAALSVPVTVPALMLAVMDYFPPFWCSKVFKRPYPPLMVVLGEKSRARGLSVMPKQTVPDRPDELAKFYLIQLRKMPPQVALEMAGANIFGLDEETKEQLLKLLQRRLNA